MYMKFLNFYNLFEIHIPISTRNHIALMGFSFICSFFNVKLKTAFELQLLELNQASSPQIRGEYQWPYGKSTKVEKYNIVLFHIGTFLYGKLQMYI